MGKGKKDKLIVKFAAFYFAIWFVFWLSLNSVACGDVNWNCSSFVLTCLGSKVIAEISSGAGLFWFCGGCFGVFWVFSLRWRILLSQVGLKSMETRTSVR